MQEQVVKIEIVERTKDKVKVKFPFLEIPVVMSYHYFMLNLEKGYFKIVNSVKNFPLPGQQDENYGPAFG